MPFLKTNNSKICFNFGFRASCRIEINLNGGRARNSIRISNTKRLRRRPRRRPSRKQRPRTKREIRPPMPRPLSVAKRVVKPEPRQRNVVLKLEGFKFDVSYEKIRSALLAVNRRFQIIYTHYSKVHKQALVRFANDDDAKRALEMLGGEKLVVEGREVSARLLSIEAEKNYLDKNAERDERYRQIMMDREWKVQLDRKLGWIKREPPEDQFERFGRYF